MPKKSEMKLIGPNRVVGIDKRVAANSPKGAKSTAEKAKAANAMAYGTKQIKVRSYKNLADELTSTKPRANRNAKILGKAGKVIKVTSKQGVSGPYGEKATVKRVDLDAYDLLSKQAKASGLKGKEAEAAISKALGKVSTRMTNDRQRTAARGKAILNRQAKKRQSINLG
jgi:hypothetical protein